jgi:hypothetical protein
VAVDGSGNVYVADTYNNRVQKFSSTGSYLTQWGSYGSGNGQLYYPYGVAVDGSGNVYVVDTYNHRVQRFARAAVSELKGCALQANSGSAYFVYGDPHRMTLAVATYDVAAGSNVNGMCLNTQFQRFDTDPTVVSQNTADKGRLLLNEKTALMFGGPNPNLAVRYLEQQRLAPLYFEVYSGGGTYLKFVETATGTAKVNVLASGYDSEHEDYFMIESLIDANYNHVFISYGFDWKGTWAAGLQVKTLYPTLQSMAGVYYIYHWVDTNANGIPESAEITQIATG